MRPGISSDSAFRRVGHDPSARQPTARTVVVTSAVPRDHPELERARALGIPVIRRAEALAEAVAGGTLVAIRRDARKDDDDRHDHGSARRQRALDPTGVVGGRVASWGGNLRPRTHRLWRSSRPTIRSIVSRIDADASPSSRTSRRTTWISIPIWPTSGRRSRPSCAGGSIS